MSRHPRELGLVVLALSLAVLLVSWPPPSLGFQPLFGFGTVFLAAPLSFVALLVAIVGGALAARPLARERQSGAERLTVSVLGPVVPVALESAYLVVVVGLGPRGTVVLGPVLIAVLVGVLVGYRDERRSRAPVA